MKKLTKLQNHLCPVAIAEIRRRHDESRKSDRDASPVVFKGLAYIVEDNGDVWHVAPCPGPSTPEPYENTWTDATFAPVPPPTPRFTPPTISTDEVAKGTDARVVGRRRIEIAICRRLLLDLSRWGCWVAIDDGDGQLQQVTDGNEALRTIFSVDSAWIYVSDAGAPTDDSQCIALILGNDGYDVIFDYHASLEPLLGEIFDWIEEAEEKGLCPECEAPAPADLSTVRPAYDAKDPRTFMRAALAALDQNAVHNVHAPAQGDIRQARAWIQQALALADEAEAIAEELERNAPEPAPDCKGAACAVLAMLEQAGSPLANSNAANALRQAIA